MIEIALAEDLIPAVENGTKRVTIRTGHRGYTRGPALIGGVLVEIKDVQWATLMSVPLETAQADGFENRNDMLEGMRRFYPDINRESPVTIVHFEKA